MGFLDLIFGVRPTCKCGRKMVALRRGFPLYLCKCGVMKVGDRTVTLDGPANLVRWSASGVAAVLGEMGMDVATGRPNAFSTVAEQIAFLTDLQNRRLFYADQLDLPVNSNWAVNALAPPVADSLNPGLTVSRFDDTTEEGVGWIYRAPLSTANLTLSMLSRPEAAGGGDVIPRLYLREVTPGGTTGAWSAGLDLTALTFPATTNWLESSQTLTFGALGITAGRTYQFELTRNAPAGGDTLVGDWDLLELGVLFAK